MKAELLIFSCLFALIYADNICTSLVDCGKCMKESPLCAWCSDSQWGNITSEPRCNLKTLMSGCVDITDLKGKHNSTENKDFSQTIQVKPQKAYLELRPGLPTTFTVKVKPAENFPVNLYLLMDLSYSMKDDLEKLRSLGGKIAETISTITKNYRLAFGSFVDKPIAPYIRLEQLKNPCVDINEQCEPTFGFKHVFNFSRNATAFEAAVKAQRISGNWNTPEGVLDGLMQVTVCTKGLQWPPKDQARRIVVIVTDAPPNVAGDGKVGGILKQNDGACHLGINNVYTESENQDFPSFAQMKSKLKENNIVPIFAVTQDVRAVYQKLTNNWAELGAAIGTLTGDSSNIVQLIRDNYKKIAQTVRLFNNKVEGLTVKYSPKVCRKPQGDSICNDVSIEGEVVEFDVTVTAQSCPANDWEKLRNFIISIPGFGEVEVDVKLLCQCPCEISGVGKQNSLKCNGTGTFQCGICYCNPGRYGDKCECDGSSQSETSGCLRANETDICSGSGECICGSCVCEKRQNPQVISGKFCECTNFDCNRHMGKICGGAERGQCECNVCKCKDKYYGDNCGQVNCTVARQECLDENGVSCSGNGECDCGICRCDKGYEGKFCEKCVSCPRKCLNNKDCVFCQAFNKGSEDVCSNCNLNIRMVNETDEQCVYSLNDGCYINFSFEQKLGENETVIVQRIPKCVQVVKSKTNILAIVLGTIGGILFVGLLALLIWKFCITAFDRHEYRKFKKEQLELRWQKNTNPVFVSANKEYVNPKYAGND